MPTGLSIFRNGWVSICAWLATIKWLHVKSDLVGSRINILYAFVICAGWVKFNNNLVSGGLLIRQYLSNHLKEIRAGLIVRWKRQIAQNTPPFFWMCWGIYVDFILIFILWRVIIFNNISAYFFFCNSHNWIIVVSCFTIFGATFTERNLTVAKAKSFVISFSTVYSRTMELGKEVVASSLLLSLCIYMYVSELDIHFYKYKQFYFKQLNLA